MDQTSKKIGPDSDLLTDSIDLFTKQELSGLKGSMGDCW